VSAGAGADGDFDGVIDAGDFARWRDHYGNGYPSTSIPEPDAVSLLASIASLLGRARRETTMRV
jgi:hypothetical protein